jgi:hypothetical protein
MAESTAQNAVRWAAAQAGVALWRNNSGALPDPDGRMVRFGLGNDSARLNKLWKSSDLIGILPVTIQPHHVGRTFGIFAAVEMKDPATWRGEPKSDREKAQAAFIATVQQYGGVGGFVTSPEELERLVQQWRS